LFFDKVSLFDVYSKIYFFIILIYLWYRFANLSYDDFRQKLFEANLYSEVTVIIPCYNEDPLLLERSVESVQMCDGKKRIIIVDDGSVNGVWNKITEIKNKYDNVEIHRFEKNMGKRQALYWAFQRVNTEFIVTIDSDTLLEKRAISYLIAPLVDKNVGATTGNIILLNEKRNILTRIIAGMYLCGLNNYKKSQSVLGNVICCSGCLSAYKTKLIKMIAEDFVNQQFMGKIAKHSEDRHLTNLLLREGFKIKYVEKAVCYTETPSTLGGFLRQQQRWKRGFVRETIYLLSHSWRYSTTLFFEALIGSALPYFLSLGMQIMIVIMLFVDARYVLYFIAPSWIIFMTIRELPMFIDQPRRAVWFYWYIFLYETLLFWQNMWAILTVNEGDWLTRKYNKTRA
jgi:hyaluronan synthase